MIDFGDSYHGYVLIDLAMTVCETAFEEDVFIGIPTRIKQIVSEYISKTSITLDQFQELMAVSMIRYIYYCYDGTYSKHATRYWYIMNNKELLEE